MKAVLLILTELAQLSSMLVKLLQEVKAFSPMLVTLAGMDIFTRPEAKKAPAPILAHCEPLSNDTVFRLEHKKKAFSPMLVTLAGMDIFTRPEYAKALTPILAHCEPLANVIDSKG